MKQNGIENVSGMIIGSAFDYCVGYDKDKKPVRDKECKIPVLIALSYTGNVQKEMNAMKKSLCKLGAKEWC